MFDSLKVVKPFDAGEVSKIKKFIDHTLDNPNDLFDEHDAVLCQFKEREKDLIFPLETIKYEVNKSLTSLATINAIWDGCNRDEANVLIMSAVQQAIEKHVDPMRVQYKIDIPDNKSINISYTDILHNPLEQAQIKMEIV